MVCSAPPRLSRSRADHTPSHYVLLTTSINRDAVIEGDCTAGGRVLTQLPLFGGEGKIARCNSLLAILRHLASTSSSLKTLNSPHSTSLLSFYPDSLWLLSCFNSPIIYSPLLDSPHLDPASLSVPPPLDLICFNASPPNITIPSAFLSSSSFNSQSNYANI